MIRTYGLTHIAMAVKDLDRSSRFYGHVFGAVEVYRSAAFVQLQTPGSHDVIVLETGKPHVGKSGGIAHFGFRLADPGDIEDAIRTVEAAGGTIASHGNFVPDQDPGEPYLFARDPDGYVVEIWYEAPTPVDRAF